MLAIIAFVVAAVVLLLLGGLQTAAAAGAPVGRFVWGGSHDALPRNLRIGSAVTIVVYAGMLAVLAIRAGIIGSDSTLVRVLTWVLFAYFVIGIVMNAISRSKHERNTMVPACVLLAGATLVLALS